MNKLTKKAFNILKFSSLGFIVVYLLAAILVAGAGHNTNGAISFIQITIFSVSLFFMIHYYQKRSIEGKVISRKIKFSFFMFLMAIEVLSIFFIVMLIIQGFKDGFFSFIFYFPMILIPALFALSGWITIRYVISGK